MGGVLLQFLMPSSTFALVVAMVGKLPFTSLCTFDQAPKFKMLVVDEGTEVS